MDPALSPGEHLLLLLAFHSTRSEQFDIEVIRDCLAIAKAVADASDTALDYKTTLEQMVANFDVDQAARQELS